MNSTQPTTVRQTFPLVSASTRARRALSLVASLGLVLALVPVSFAQNAQTPQTSSTTSGATSRLSDDVPRVASVETPRNVATPRNAPAVLFDSSSRPNVSTTRFRSLSEPAIPTTAQTSPGSPAFAPAKKFVLTRLDAVCEGTLRDRGDSISVELENGGAISVSKLDVAFVGDSRADLFRYKASRTALEDVNETLKLADWANRRLMGAEGIALLESKLAESNDPAATKAFERKLAELRESERVRAAAAQVLAARAAESAKGTNDAAALQTADALAAVPPTQAPSSASSSSSTTEQTAADAAELERWAKQIPFSAFEKFGRKVQPILQKRCATGDCHSASPATSKYALVPKPAGVSQARATRDALIRNLRATFAFVDFDSPKDSPILNHPPVVGANGERVYPFGEDRLSTKDCDAFVDWVSNLNDGKLGSYRGEPRAVDATNASNVGKSGGLVGSRGSDASIVSFSTSADAPQVADTNVSFADAFAEDAVIYDSQTAANAQTAQSARSTRNERLAQNSVVPRTSGTNVIQLGTSNAARRYEAEKAAESAPKYRDEYDPQIFNALYNSDDAATRRY